MDATSAVVVGEALVVQVRTLRKLARLEVTETTWGSNGLIWITPRVSIGHCFTLSVS